MRGWRVGGTLSPACWVQGPGGALGRFPGGPGWAWPAHDCPPGPPSCVWTWARSGRIPGTAPALIKIDFSEGLGVVPAAAGAPQAWPERVPLAGGGQCCWGPGLQPEQRRAPCVSGTVSKSSVRNFYLVGVRRTQMEGWGGGSSCPEVLSSRGPESPRARASAAQQNSAPRVVLLLPGCVAWAGHATSLTRCVSSVQCGQCVSFTGGSVWHGIGGDRPSESGQGGRRDWWWWGHRVPGDGLPEGAAGSGEHCSGSPGPKPTLVLKGGMGVGAVAWGPCTAGQAT